MRRLTLPTFGLSLLLACSTGARGPVTPSSPPASPTPSAGGALMSEDVPNLSPGELIAIERAPGSTPPLVQSIEPRPAAVAGLAGTPGTSPASGPEDAPVRIYLFTDFQCPVCPRVVEPLKHLARVHPDDVRIVFKENALSSHDRSARVAAASLAAFRQGKFWEFHDRVFADHEHLQDTDLLAHATALGLDIPRFQRDMNDAAVTEQVKYEAALSASIDLASTPGFIINGTRQSGWGSYSYLEDQVKREVERARRIAAGGVPAARVAYEATRQSGPKGEQLAAALFAAPK